MEEHNPEVVEDKDSERRNGFRVMFLQSWLISANLPLFTAISPADLFAVPHWMDILFIFHAAAGLLSLISVVIWSRLPVRYEVKRTGIQFSIIPVTLGIFFLMMLDP